MKITKKIISTRFIKFSSFTLEYRLPLQADFGIRKYILYKKLKIKWKANNIN